LHPKLQANLADFFIDTTTRNNKLRWILETHSESLILRIQRRIKEGRIKPEDISINYVNSIKGGHSVIKELRLDSDGDFIDEWPDGFFEESFNERFITKN
jgi:predicted ATPase